MKRIWKGVLCVLAYIGVIFGFTRIMRINDVDYIAPIVLFGLPFFLQSLNEQPIKRKIWNGALWVLAYIMYIGLTRITHISEDNENIFAALIAMLVLVFLLQIANIIALISGKESLIRHLREVLKGFSGTDWEDPHGRKEALIHHLLGIFPLVCGLIGGIYGWHYQETWNLHETRDMTNIAGCAIIGLFVGGITTKTISAIKDLLTNYSGLAQRICAYLGCIIGFVGLGYWVSNSTAEYFEYFSKYLPNEISKAPVRLIFIAGMLVGTLLITLIGSLIGMLIDKINQALSFQPLTSTQPSHFFLCLFSMLGKMAKSDGVISRDEITMTSQFIRELGLDENDARRARRIFNEAKSDNLTIYQYADQLTKLVYEKDALVGLYEMLWRLATADGKLRSSGEEILRKIVQHLNIDRSYFDDFRAKYFSQSVDHLADCYRLLGCDETTSDAGVKRAWRRAVKRHHPDRFEAKGSPENLRRANEQTQKINAAYRAIMKAREAG